MINVWFFTLVKNFIQRYYPLFPIVGMVLYLIVFTIAAMQYPGGSENIPSAVGYSFFNNFLCDVMHPITQGGQHNPVSQLATFSHVILSSTMIAFFYLLPEIFDWTNNYTKTVRYMGVLTMTVFIFMFTPLHDSIVTATGVLGTFALIPFFIEMKKYPNGGLKILAYICFTLSIIVFFIFETRIGYFYLPFLQKITFLFDTYWVVWASLIVLRKNRALESMHSST